MTALLPKLCFLADKSTSAQQAFDDLKHAYGNVSVQKADVLIVLGGDGFMLQMLHRYVGKNKPFYGMNCGTIGFLLNRFRTENLFERVAAAKKIALHPLRMTATCANGKVREAFAFNEVSLLRQSRQAADICICVDGIKKMPRLICDGILVSTPAGSTAYNSSVHGPILPLTANVLALTPVSAFRPRRWRGALLPSGAKVSLEILQNEKRPVSAVADFTEIRNVTRVDVEQESSLSPLLMFDEDYSLEDRILNEQFAG